MWKEMEPEGKSAAERSPEQSGLSDEESLLLLEEFEAFVNDVKPGAGVESEELADRAERLISSLAALPLPAAVAAGTIESVGTWTRFLVVEGGHERQGGPEQVRFFIHEQLAVLRDLISRRAEGELE